MAGELITVIMPSYNAAATIEQSMASALQQTYRNIELIVVDDNSSDHTTTLVRRMQARDYRVRLIRRPYNSGAAAVRNIAIRQAKGELMAFLDSDDTWHPECLEKLHRALASSPDAVLSYGGWQNVGLEPQMCQPYIPPDYEAINKVAFFLKECPWPIHAILVRRDVVLELGGFDERWSSCMDFDLWLRLGWCRPLVRVPEVLAYYHHHNAAVRITRNRARIAINHWRIQRKFVNEHPHLESQFGIAQLREMIEGELMRRGFEAYWRRDFETARIIFRHVMLDGYGLPKDWQYMLLSFLPERWYKSILNARERKRG